MNIHTQDQAESGGVQTQLRYGVILDGGRIEAWQAECLQELLDRAGAIVELIVVFPHNVAAGGRSIAGASSLAKVSGANVIAGKPRLNCAPKEQRAGGFILAESEVTDIERRRLDFIIDFGNRRLNGKALASATHGIWTFSFANPGKYPDGLPGIREMLSGDPVAEARLVRLGASGHGAILRRGVFPVTKDSSAETVDRLHYGVTAWPAQVCIDLANGCAEYLREPDYSATLNDYDRFGPGDLAGLGLRCAWERVKRLYGTVFRSEEWNVGIVRQPIESFLHSATGYHVDWLSTPKRGSFIADPFGVVHGGERHVFFEDFNYNDRHGVIAGGVVEGDPPVLRDAGTAIDRSTHLSYPFIVEDAGQVYCIPEARATGELQLFRAIELPHKWEFQVTLLSGVDAIDPTVFKHAGRWWLLFVSKDKRTHSELLQVHHAPQLTGPWVPHANNPVKSDVHSTRPGGTPFISAGELYRPVQDCGETYGRRVLLNRIVKLTPTEFVEETIGSVEPPRGTPYNKGIHTLSALGDWTLIDAKRFVFVPAVLQKKVANLFSRVFKRRKKKSTAE